MVSAQSGSHYVHSGAMGSLEGGGQKVVEPVSEVGSLAR
jgi:hypothetical protein